MKKNTIGIALLLFALTQTACVEGPQKQDVDVKTSEEVKQQKAEVPDAFDVEFKDVMVDKIFQNYTQLHLALYKDDAPAASRAAANMVESLSHKWPELKSIAKRMADADEIGGLRIAFSEFTMEFGKLLETSVKEGKLYKQYCPMAFEDKGAYWYSDSPEIKNPYMGQKMPDCGSVESIITKK